MENERAQLDIESMLAERIRHLRLRGKFTLDELAQRSGVSRSMISLIERGQCSPTANVLNKLATAFGVSLASLFALGASRQATPLARACDQREWRDPETGYLRRNLSPPTFPSPIELVDVTLPPNARVTLDSPRPISVLQQQVWILAGTVSISGDGFEYSLCKGDCVAMEVGAVTVFHNRGPGPARYLIALARSE